MPAPTDLPGGVHGLPIRDRARAVHWLRLFPAGPGLSTAQRDLGMHLAVTAVIALGALSRTLYVQQRRYARHYAFVARPRCALAPGRSLEWTVLPDPTALLRRSIRREPARDVQPDHDGRDMATDC